MLQSKPNFKMKKKSAAEKMAIYRAKETPEQREKRLMADRLRQAARRASETPEERERRLEAERLRQAFKRTTESRNQWAQRLQSDCARQSAKRASETPEERAKRLESERLRQAKKRASETPEERERRLQAVRERQAARRAAETLEEWERRLQADSARQSAKRASETLEERERRLALERARQAAKRASETPEEREKRRLADCARQSAKRALETPAEREARRKYGRMRQAAKRLTQYALKRNTNSLEQLTCEAILRAAELSFSGFPAMSNIQNGDSKEEELSKMRRTMECGIWDPDINEGSSSEMSNSEFISLSIPSFTRGTSTFSFAKSVIAEKNAMDVIIPKVLANVKKSEENDSDKMQATVPESEQILCDSSDVFLNTCHDSQVDVKSNFPVCEPKLVEESTEIITPD